jgi:REP element-mobilizing transposase RayT
MANSLRQIYIHLVWATKHRTPTIKGGLEKHIHRRLNEIADNLGLRMVAVNSAWDHTHSLVEWNTTRTLQDAIKQMKSRTTVEWFQAQNERGLESTFKWQRGGGIFSIDKQRVPSLAQYIANQKDIHRARQTRAEFELKTTRKK